MGVGGVWTVSGQLTSKCPIRSGQVWHTYENVLNEPIGCEPCIVVTKSQGGDEAEVASPE